MSEGRAFGGDSGCAATGLAASPKVLFPDSVLGNWYDKIQAGKKNWRVPITIGAWNWEHVNTGGSLNSGYGVQGLRGTYFWYADIDPQLEVDWGPITKIGIHTEVRAREYDHFRTFVRGQVWTYENYAFMETVFGTFKAGQIWKRFGLDWDNSFWGNTAFWDGFKLNADYGIAWEKTWKIRDGWKIESFAQFFFHEDRIAGELGTGSNVESVPGAHQLNTGNIRFLSTYEFDTKSRFALGISGQAGEVTNIMPSLPRETVGAWAIDATYTRGPLKIYGEVLRSYGVINPKRYTSGGPSDRLTDFMVGLHYTVGPATFRFDYSGGFDQHPSGRQTLWNPGVTVAVTKNVDFYVEYARQDFFSSTKHTVFENGMQFVLNWRF